MFEPGHLHLSSTKPDYWSRLGSSKSRTSTQEQMGQEYIRDQMNDAPDNSAFAFTDGSCRPNPGPCGAGAVIYLPHGEEPINLKRPVTIHGSILLGELVAILAVLEYILSYIDHLNATKLIIFSDSQTSIGVVSLNWKPTCYHDLINNIKAKIEAVRSNGIDTELIWTPGHANIEGNDIADKLANEAAEEAASLPEDSALVTQQDVIHAARKFVTHKWQKRWDNSNTGRTLFDYKPDVNSKTFLDEPSPHAYKSIMQLRTGYSCLNDYRHRINPALSRLCDCGQPETVNHIISECPNYEEDRARMNYDLGRDLGLWNADSQTLLEYEDDENIPGWRTTIIQHLGTYVEKTQRFRKERLATHRTITSD